MGVATDDRRGQLGEHVALALCQSRGGACGFLLDGVALHVWVQPAFIERADDFAVRVATHTPGLDAERRKLLKSLARHRPGRDVAADDDGIDIFVSDVGQYGGL